MVKCVERHPQSGVKCQRHLVECIRSGIHAGRRYVRAQKGSTGSFLAYKWVRSLAPTDTVSVEWQGKLRAEIRRLGFLAKWGRSLPGYEELKLDVKLLRTHLVRVRETAFGVRRTIRLGDGVVRDVDQGVLEIDE